MAKASFGNFVKAVVDIDKAVMVVDASFHADEETYLLSQGSMQQDLWGVNLYPELDGEDFIEFDSMINVRPGKGNITRGVDDSAIQKKIRSIVDQLIT
ncbi:hypothetical protein HY948_01680 [Candidatus Gottesmanbacteria bacterium]|nr:hypothetical protein [Candidatus Gottesmanbacteria bacterium]